MNFWLNGVSSATRIRSGTLRVRPAAACGPQARWRRLRGGAAERRRLSARMRSLNPNGLTRVALTPSAAHSDLRLRWGKVSIRIDRPVERPPGPAATRTNAKPSVPGMSESTSTACRPGVRLNACRASAALAACLAESSRARCSMLAEDAARQRRCRPRPAPCGRAGQRGSGSGRRLLRCRRTAETGGEAEDAALPRPAAHADPSAHQSHQLRGNGQPEPVPP